MGCSRNTENNQLPVSSHRVQLAEKEYTLILHIKRITLAFGFKMFLVVKHKSACEN